MKALDTNVLIRFLVRDDEKQAALVLGLFNRQEAGERVWLIFL